MTSSDLLARTGRALYGDGFQPQLAAALGVRQDTVRHWLSGRESVPSGVWAELVDLLEARECETMNLRHEVTREFVKASR